MPQDSLDQRLLDQLRQAARKKSREDRSASYNQWLNELCHPYGFKTYASLKRYIEEIERAEQVALIKAEEQIWQERFAKSAVFGTLGTDVQDEYRETVPLPMSGGGNVPWPHCFMSSSLFTAADGPRRQCADSLVTFDVPDMHYVGEELRIDDDHDVLMALVLLGGRFPCGRLIEFLLGELTEIFGGRPIKGHHIARSFWRLSNCKLDVPAQRFSGPILSFADVSEAPAKFRFRFNPKLVNLYRRIPLF